MKISREISEQDKKTLNEILDNIDDTALSKKQQKKLLDKINILNQHSEDKKDIKYNNLISRLRKNLKDLKISGPEKNKK